MISCDMNKKQLLCSAARCGYHVYKPVVVIVCAMHYLLQNIMPILLILLQFNNFNFYLFEVVSRYRDPLLQVGEN